MSCFPIIQFPSALKYPKLSHLLRSLIVNHHQKSLSPRLHTLSVFSNLLSSHDNLSLSKNQNIRFVSAHFFHTLFLPSRPGIITDHNHRVDFQPCEKSRKSAIFRTFSRFCRRRRKIAKKFSKNSVFAVFQKTFSTAEKSKNRKNRPFWPILP